MNINALKTRFTIIGVYGPNEDEPVANKDFFFYEILQRVVTDFGNNRELVFIGDFNDRNGRSGSSIIRRFGEESDDNGARLIDSREQIIETEYSDKEAEEQVGFRAGRSYND